MTPGRSFPNIALTILLCAACLAGCTALPAPEPAPSPARGLVVTLLYPGPQTEVTMGQGLRFIARVADEQGIPVTGARLTIAIREGNSQQVIGTVETTSDSDGVYRGGPWPVPHRIPEGPLQLSLTARQGDATGEASGSVLVEYSVSDTLLNKYGFWLDAPVLKGIVPTLVAELGDARNGLIRWGGTIPAQHVLPENWVEVHWREGRHTLESADAVRRFMLEEVGNLGFTRIRSIGPFERFEFKKWDAWKVGARAQVQPTQVEFVAFYAPEVDKTYLLGTTVTLPPVGIDPHAALRAGFEVHPEVQASGVARVPLPDLAPGPELLSPPLGARFYGSEQPIVLRWQPAEELTADEVYRVSVDYSYVEANIDVTFETRETHLTLPAGLYEKPNCGVFNWEVTVMQLAASDSGDRPVARPVSHASLYWYVEWRYPPDAPAPFAHRCPNAQF